MKRPGWKRATVGAALVLAFAVLGLGIQQGYETIHVSETPQASVTSEPSYPPAMGAATGDTVGTAPTSPRFSLPQIPAALSTLGKESISQALIRLTIAGRRGNPQAAWEAYQIASFCAQRDSLAALVERLSSTQIDPNALAGIKASHTRTVELCGDVTPALLDDRFANVRIAAEAGVKGAADTYFTEGPRGVRPELLQQLRDDPNVVAWRVNSLSLLTRDAESGDLNAISRLAHIYQDGIVVPKDMLSALVYQTVATELQARDGVNRQFETMQRRRVALLSQALSDSERQAAQQKADELLKKCCARNG